MPDPDHPFNQGLAQLYWQGVKRYQGFGVEVDWIHETDYFKVVRKEVRQKACSSFEQLLRAMNTGDTADSCN